MNTLKINGTTISGIYVDAAVSYNKPAKRVQTFEVPGRNGNLIIDEGTFDNVMITYPVYEKQTFPAEFDDLVNWLASLEGYQRIECSNDPGHYRLGRFVVPQTPTVKRLNRDGYYQLSFDCKPQRWLLSGEEDTEVDANPQETYEGEIATFEAEALDVISDLKVAIEPVQSGSGDPSPTNIRPISGWSGAEVYVSGENFYTTTGVDRWNTSTAVSSPTSTSIRVQGTGSSSYPASKQPLSNYNLVNGKQYVIRCYANVTNGKVQFGIRSNDGVFNASAYNLDGESGIYVVVFTYDSTTMANHSLSFMCNVGERGGDVTYEDIIFAELNTNINISWQTEAGTVYGGTLDVTTGVLTVDRAIKDMGTFDWGMTTVNGVTVFRDNPIASLIPLEANNAISSAYKWVDGMTALTGADGNGTFVPRTNYWSSSNLRTVVRDDRFSDVASFTAAVTGQTICYKLATPLTYQLSPTEVETLLGQNNIWANTGDVSVTVTTPTNFINPGTFASKPIIRVYGAGTFRVGDVVVTITSHSQPYIDIDCEMQDSYYGSTNMNAYVAFSSGEFPELAPGNNYVLLGTGITKLEVTPRWWEL